MHWFKTTSKSELFKSEIAEKPDWAELDELNDYKNLSNWYNKTMKTSEAYESLKYYDTMMRDQLDEKI